MKPLASMSTGELGAAAKEALLLSTTHRLGRITGGFYSQGRKVSLRIADQLIARGLARIEISGGRHQLVPTGAGRMLADVVRFRRAQR